MTYAQGQTTRPRRSRILGSIFARTPRDIHASPDEQSDLQRQPSTSPNRTGARAQPAGWRGITTRHARETLAERICGRFFARSDASDASSKPQAGFVSAGQHLQALGESSSITPVEARNLAAILDAAAQTPQAYEGQARLGGDAMFEAGLTAKAA
jgi:hypothetical protein